MRRRRAPFWLLPLLVTACGREDEANHPATSPPVSVSPTSARPTPERRKGEREEIPPEDEAVQRTQVLEPRDVPLRVGGRAPSFAGYPEKSRAVIVFFRGEW